MNKNATMGMTTIPHIRREFWGMVVIPIVAFLFMGQMIGWASAPFDPAWERRFPKRAALMALAGPAANFTLMLIGAVGLRTLAYLQVPGEGIGFLVATLFAMFNLNLLLGVFNLLPLAPLDGSTVSTTVQTAGNGDKFKAQCASAIGGDDADVDFALPSAADLTIAWAQAGNHDFALYPDVNDAAACNAGTQVNCTVSAGQQAGSYVLSNVPGGKS